MFGQTTGKNILMQHFKEELSESLVNLISEFFPGHSPVQYPPVRISYRVKISSTCCLHARYFYEPIMHISRSNWFSMRKAVRFHFLIENFSSFSFI